jgi:hypothetical protein
MYDMIFVFLDKNRENRFMMFIEECGRNDSFVLEEYSQLLRTIVDEFIASDAAPSLRTTAETLAYFSTRLLLAV